MPGRDRQLSLDDEEEFERTNRRRILRKKLIKQEVSSFRFDRVTRIALLLRQDDTGQTDTEFLRRTLDEKLREEGYLQQALKSVQDLVEEEGQKALSKPIDLRTRLGRELTGRGARSVSEKVEPMIDTKGNRHWPYAKKLSDSVLEKHR